MTSGLLGPSTSIDALPEVQRPADRLGVADSGTERVVLRGEGT